MDVGSHVLVLGGAIGYGSVGHVLFSSFSVYFLLANLVAAVMVPFILYGAVLMVLTSGLPMVQEWVVKLLNEGVMALNSLAGWIRTLPYATFSFSMLKPDTKEKSLL